MRDTADVVLHGRPSSDLRAYAAERGLEWRDQAPQVGYRIIFPMAKDRQFNVLRGELPGGEYGVMAHTINRTAERTHAPMTAVAVSVPEAVGAVLRFDLARLAPRADDDYNERDDALAPEGWRLTRARAAERETLAAGLDPAAVDALSQLPWSPSATFDYGILRVRCAGFMDEPAELDELAHVVTALAAGLRSACRRANRGFDGKLDPPTWIDEPYSTKKRFGMEIHSGKEATRLIQSADSVGLEAPLHGRWRELLPELSDSTGLEVEDALAFHRAFPGVPVPGQAFAVLRGELPHGGRGRAALYADRGIDMNLGLTAVLLPAPPGTAETSARPGEVLEPNARYAVRGGIVAAWRGWPTAELDVTDEITRLADDVAKVTGA